MTRVEKNREFLFRAFSFAVQQAGSLRRVVVYGQCARLKRCSSIAGQGAHPVSCALAVILEIQFTCRRLTLSCISLCIVWLRRLWPRNVLSN